MAVASIDTYLFPLHMLFPFAFSKHLSWPYFLPDKVTQTFTSERSEPLVILPKLGHFSFPLTLITGMEIQRLPKRYHSRYSLFQFQCGVAVKLPLVVCITHPNQHSNSLLWWLMQRHQETKVDRGQS